MTILDVASISKSFGGVRAVVAVSFQVAAGEMLALIGPNGAGKSTCFDMLNGQTAPDAGRILVRNVYGWFERTGRGMYRLTALGEAAVQRWPGTVLVPQSNGKQPNGTQAHAALASGPLTNGAPAGGSPGGAEVPSATLRQLPP